MENLSLDVLRRSCKANGLPTSGNKDDLLNRLMTGQGDQRRKSAVAARKPALKGTKESVVVDNEDVPPMQFTITTSALLKNAGFDDDEWIAAEVKRRWIQSKKKEVESTEADTELPCLLTEEQQGQLNLVLIDSEPNDSGKYRYKKIPDKSSASKAKIDPSSDDKKRVRSVDVDEPPIKKVKKEEEEEETDYMKWPTKVSTERMMLKNSKTAMIAMLTEYGVEVDPSASKRDVATALAEQMHYETDEEEEAGDTVD